MSAIDIIGIVVSGISLLTTVIGGGMAWQKIKDRSDENRRRVDELERRIGAHDGLTTKLAVLAERLIWIQRQLGVRNGGGTEHRKRDDSEDA